MAEELPWNKPENLLDFALIKDPFDTLLRATENKIEREWPKSLGGNIWYGGPFLFSLRTARWTLVSSLYLLADTPEDPRRHLEYAIAIPPLNRTILDLLFNFVFIFDDFHDRLCWYLQSGAEEVGRKIRRFSARYSGDPAWDSFLARAARAENPFLRNRDEVCGGKLPTSKGRFPHPGAMLQYKSKFKNPDSFEFLAYLNDWFYRDLSSSSHGHWGGLPERAAQILRLQTDDQTQLQIARKYKSDCVFEQLTLTLCLVSEIIAAAGFDNKAQAGYIWGILNQYWGDAHDLHARRYQSLLS